MIKTDIYICDGDYSQITEEYGTDIKKACANAMMRDNIPGTLNIRLVSEIEIRDLNRNFRNVDSVTDVLSFPSNILDEPIAKNGITCDMEIEDEMIVLGDIAICVNRAMEQAADFGHSLRRELCFLALHGTLHVMGYDHVTADGEKEMFEIQEEILDSLGITR